MKEIDVTELEHELKTGDRTHIVIDVRTPEERTDERIQGTINIPLSRIGEQIDFLNKYDAVYVHCGSGARSAKVCEQLTAQGLENIINVKGGVSAWTKTGHQLIATHKLSITRQVRITAGLLVVTSVLLAHFVETAYILIAMFVGGGLTFAGVTGKCGMAAVLLRMPWNRIR
jgi:rhodanese-related sulfurtransferase